jgi:predicted PurR-regulated permease PerM
MQSIQQFILSSTYFIGNVLIPFLFGLALLFFLFHAARYFIIGGSNEEAQDKAKTLALYGIIAFVFLVSIWGIVNILVYGLGFWNDNALAPDYFGTRRQDGYYIESGIGGGYEEDSWGGEYNVDQFGPQ